MPERPTSTPPATGGPPGARHIAFQLWQWAADGRSYELELFTLRELPDGWSVHSAKTHCRAILREELSALIREEGCRPRWLMPDESGFFQPLSGAD